MSRRSNPKTPDSPALFSGPWPWIAGILGYVLFLFRDLVSGAKVLFYRDHLMVYLPRDASFRAAISEGSIPLWDALFLGGQPFAANPGRQVFYPPHYLVLLGDLATGYGLFVLFHVVVAALGMFALVRFAGGSNAAAALGSVSLALCGPFLSSIHLLPTLCAVSWMPWIARFAEGFLRTRRPLEFLGASVALALLALGGDPVQAPLSGALLLGWSLARQSRGEAGAVARGAGRDALSIAAIGAVALLLASVQLWPAIDFAGDTVRAERMTFEMVSHWSLPPARALEFFFPAVFETLAPGTLYKSTGGAALLVSVNLGFVTCILLLGALGSRMKGAGWVAATIVILGVLAIGSHTPLLRLLYDSGLPSLRYPEKLILPAVVIAVAWVALAFDRLRGGDRAMLRWVTGAGVVLAVAALGFLLVRDPVASTAARDAARAYWLKMAVLSGIAVALLAFAGRSRGTVAAVLVVAFAGLADLGMNARRWTPAVPAGLLEPPLVTQTLDGDKGLYRILNDAALQLMDYGDPNGDAWFKAIDLLLHRNAMFPMANGIWGYASVLEWDTEHTALVPTTSFQSAMYQVRESGQTRWLPMFASMANARYSTAFRPIQSARLDARADALSIRPVDFIRVGDSPRYAFATSLRRLTGRDDFVDALKRGDWATGAAWVEIEPFEPAPGEVVEVDEQRHDIRLRVRSEGRGYLNVAITPHRYWSATIDGANAPLHVTNLGFQGLEVPAGEHTIELRYRNPVIAPAIGVSVATLIALVAATFALEARRRSREV